MAETLTPHNYSLTLFSVLLLLLLLPTFILLLLLERSPRQWHIWPLVFLSSHGMLLRVYGCLVSTIEDFSLYFG